MVKFFQWLYGPRWKPMRLSKGYDTLRWRGRYYYRKPFSRHVWVRDD